MAVDKFLDRIDDLLEEAWNLPFTGGKRMIDVEKIRNLLDEVRLNLPQEIKDAKNIVADREEILKDANIEAENLIKAAEDRARKMISEQQIVISARERANEIVTDAHSKVRATERAVVEFSEATLKRAEDALVAAHTDIKNTRNSIRNRRSDNNSTRQ
ncbi:MAG: ATPase [Oscillospiraceae bacterium]|nr:ATPase [Oscillospiraceae bacterium]